MYDGKQSGYSSYPCGADRLVGERDVKQIITHVHICVQRKTKFSLRRWHFSEHPRNELGVSLAKTGENTVCIFCSKKHKVINHCGD